MLLFVVGAFSALVAFAGLGLGKIKYQDYRGDEKEIPLRLGSAIVLLFSAFLMALGSIYTQDPGEVILIRGAGGNVIRTDRDAGFGFTAPWNKKTSFNIRNQRIEMFSNKGGEGDDGAAISSPLKNGSNVAVSVTVQVDIKPDAVADIYKQQRGQKQLWDNVLKPGLRDEVRRQTANFTAFDIKQRRGELVTAITEGLETRWSKVGVSVNNVDLGDLGLDAETEKALEQVSAAQARLEEARIDAEKTRVEAKATTDGDQIIRCGATVTVEKQIVADKEIEVTVVTPKTGAACENRLNEQVLIAKYIEALEKMSEHGWGMVVPQGFSGILNLPAPQG